VVHARCLREARRLLSGPDAEDAAQEAALRAWRKQGECRSQSARAAWVAKIARNEALRLISSGRPTVQMDEEHAGHPAVPDSTGDSIAQLDFELATRGLSRHEKLLVRMRFINDLSDAQIAEMLGTPVGTAKVRVHRLRAKLRESLNGYDPDHQ
jgi:RNA polymerase sigma-70 factor (ECF subfamily)